MTLICILLVCACVYDYHDKRIPNWLIMLLLIVVFAMTHNWLNTLIQMLSVVALLYILFKIGALGAGDVKLLGVCAGIFPAEKILIFLFISLFIAAIFSLFRLIREQNIIERLLYLYEYFVSVMQNGAWQLYIENENERKMRGICLAGPILCSVLLYLGGAY